MSTKPLRYHTPEPLEQTQIQEFAPIKTTVLLLILFTLFSLNTVAQDSPQWHLPDGAKARLGKGTISGNIAHSPDGTRLAVASAIGIWLYDTAA